jgi:hypothetical protein
MPAGRLGGPLDNGLRSARALPRRCSDARMRAPGMTIGAPAAYGRPVPETTR